jgi:hypothetical protein
MQDGRAAQCRLPHSVRSRARVEDAGADRLRRSSLKTKKTGMALRSIPAPGGVSPRRPVTHPATRTPVSVDWRQGSYRRCQTHPIAPAPCRRSACTLAPAARAADLPPSTVLLDKLRSHSHLTAVVNGLDRRVEVRSLDAVRLFERGKVQSMSVKRARGRHGTSEEGRSDRDMTGVHRRNHTRL